MSINFSSFLTVAAILFGLAGLAGATFAVFKSKLMSENLSILERTNSGQNQRIEFLEAQDKRKDEDLKAKEAAIKVLTDLVTGHEQLNTILQAIKVHDDKLEVRDRRLFSDLETIIDVLGQLKEKVSLRDVQ